MTAADTPVGLELSLIVTLPETLSLRTLRQAIARNNAAASDIGEGTLHIDMSRVEFADFGALAQVLLLADGAARSRRQVRIDLPVPWMSEQQELTHLAAEAAVARARCLQFLRATGFVSAGLLPHLPGAVVEMRVLPAGDDDLGVDVGPSPKPTGDVARILTFRWLAPQLGEQLWRSDSLVSIIRGLRDIGLPNRDAQLLANAVLFELLENVTAHASDDRENSHPHALVGAIAVDADRVPPPTSVPPELQPFAEWSTRSTMIRIVVGDSGIGLVNHLSPYAPDGLPQPESAQPEESWSAADKIALWALERWSTSPAESNAVPRGTRGLWRALRAIRSYGDGALLVHTVGAAAGYVFMEDRAEAVRISEPSGAPGTLLDVRVLPDARSTSAEAATVVASPATDSSIDLHWLRLEGESTDSAIFAEADRLVRASRHVLFTVDGGPTHHLAHERLVNILASAAGLATPAVIAVVVTGIDPVAVDAGIDALHHPPPESVAGTGDPFLLIDGTGIARWCGGLPDVRDLLQKLMNGPLSLTSSPGVSTQLRALLADQPHLVQRVGESLQLLLHTSDVVERLERLAAEALRTAIEGDGPGVLRGSFRTPNLRLTKTWVEVDRVIERATGTGIAAFLLSQKLANLAPEALRRDTHVIQISAVVPDLAKMLAESARLRRGVYQMIDDAVQPTAVEPLPPNTWAVLCGDVLLTENDAAHVAKEILRQRATPAAIVVPLDARSHDGPLEVGRVEIPVIALAKVQNETPGPDDGPIVDIDPVFRNPAVRTYPERHQYQWSREEFLHECLDLPWVMGLGHLVRPGVRHFAAYFDASRLLDSSSRLREQVADGMVESILDWLQQRPTSDKDVARPIAICHAGSQDGYARRFAALLGRRLIPRLKTPSALIPVQVARAVAGSRYAFPDAMELPAGCDVVLIDWGSFDATTVLQLIRLAAEGGARRIFTVILLSQLAEHDERAMTMIRSVAGASLDAPTVPTTVKFLTTVGISPTARSDCTLCRMAESLRAEAQYGTLPREVAAHANSLASSLRPLSRDLVAERKVDAFGARATTEDAIEYVRLRSLLLVALRSTGEAALVADEIAQLRDSPLDRRAQALIRLLAAEQQWLRLRPVRLRQCMANVALLATAMATEPRLDDRLRLQAIVVLAYAAPEVLVDNLNSLWRSALQSDELLLHLLYELWAMVGPSVKDAAMSFTELRSRLATCLTFGHEDYLSPERAEDMQYLLKQLLFALDRPESEPMVLTPVQAWARLREYYLHLLDRHSDAETAVINLLVFMEDLPAGPDPLASDVWQTMFRSWSAVAAFLKNRVLPFTPPLSQILDGAFAQEHFSRVQRARLLRLTSPHALNEIAVLESQMHQLRRGTSEDTDFEEIWLDIARRLDEWYRVVLSAGAHRLSRADLADFLDPCPAPLMAVLKDCQELARRKGEPVEISLVTQGLDEIDVFVHEDLLRNAVHQIIDNTVKPTHRQPEHQDSVVDLQIEVEVLSKTVRLRCRNTGTRPTEAPTPPGKGIGSIHRKLEDFGASLKPVPPKEGWTFEIELLLTLWSQVEVKDPLS